MWVFSKGRVRSGEPDRSHRRAAQCGDAFRKVIDVCVEFSRNSVKQLVKSYKIGPFNIPMRRFAWDFRSAASAKL